MVNENLILSSHIDYTKLFDALSHPMRVKVIGILLEKRRYVSELAKIMNMSRPLLYMHLKKLEEAAIVTGSYEISDSGKSMKYYEAKSFDVHLTPDMIISLSETIPIEPNGKS
ncbi:MAG: winged helix-turn-helix domain-containing protein [Defluviitaleaceae bacterium]|nr:winged helix-turn-helix domain-containing protein [Defluviitaleaceae bacterium]